MGSDFVTTLLEVCSDGIAVARMSDGRLLEVSDAFLRLTGYERQELIGRTTLEVGLWADPEDRGRFIEDIRQRGTLSRYPVRFRTRDGRLVSVEMSAHVVEIEGEPCILGLNRELGGDAGRLRRAEDQRDEAEARYRTLVEQIPAVLYVDLPGPEMTSVYVSPQVELILGIDRKRYMAEPDYWYKRVHPDDREKMHADYLRWLEEGTPGHYWSGEYRFIREDGQLVWLIERADAIRDPSGRPILVQGVMFDISDRRVAEDRLREAEAKFRTLVERMPAVTYIDAPDEPRIRYISPQVEELTGFASEEWIRDPSLWEQRIHPDDRDRTVAAWRHQFERWEPFRAEYRLLHRDGSVRWIREEAVPVTDHRGEPLMILGVAVDVTEEMRAHDALGDSEARFRALADSTFEAVVIHEDGRILDANRAFGDLFGYERDEVIGRSALEFVAPSSREAAGTNIRSEAEGPFEETGLRKDGSTFSMEVRARLVPYQGRTVRMVAIRDITERTWLEQELIRVLRTERQAVDRLHSADDMKSTLLRVVSHDLRTPLAGILWLAQMLQRADMDLSPEETRGLAADIAASAGVLDRMVNDLLDLDRMERGVLEPDRRPTDLGELLHRVADQTDLEGRTVEVRAEPTVVAIDGPKVERIVSNLLTNAARHTPEGSPVWVRLESDRRGVVIVVEDQGPGITEERRASLFDRIKPGEEGAGPRAGVGLALVARFAELHRGHAWVEARPGGGASFRVFLPRVVS